jgi:hypothetical protein
VLVKLVVAYVDAFHFTLDAAGGEALVLESFSAPLGVDPHAVAGGGADAETGVVGAGSMVRARVVDAKGREVTLGKGGPKAVAPAGKKGAVPGEGEEAAREEAADEEEAEQEDAGAGAGAGRKEATPKEIYAEVVSKLLPELEKHMTEKAEQQFREGKALQQGSLRGAICVAVVKVLRLLPEKRTHMRLPHVVGTVCNALRTREQSARDATRRALAEIARTLGPFYLSFLLGEVVRALQRGYQRHVAGASVVGILEAMEPEGFLEGAQLVPSLPLLLEVFRQELSGEVADEKEVEAIAGKTREARSTRMYDAAEIIGRALDFKLFQPCVLDPAEHEFGIQGAVLGASTLKARNKMRELLRRFGLGLAANKTVMAPVMLPWVHSQVLRYVPACAESAPEQAGKGKKDAADKGGASADGDGGGPDDFADPKPQRRSKLLEPKSKHAHILPPVGESWERAARAGAAGGAVTLRQKGGAARGAAVTPPPPSLPYKVDTSRPSLRTNWTRLVHPSVLSGHVSSISPY